MADDCERFEIDLEGRARGALGPDESRALDEHLASCAPCQAFARLARGVDAHLRQKAALAREIPWPAIEGRLAERARRTRRSRWIVPTALLGAAAVSFALGVPLRGALLMAAAALVTTALARRLSTRWLRELAQAETSREGLLVFSRKQVEDELRAARFGAVALAGLAIVQVLGIELLGHPSAGSRVAVGGGAVLLLAAAAQLALREAPRLRRERQELT